MCGSGIITIMMIMPIIRNTVIPITALATARAAAGFVATEFGGVFALASRQEALAPGGGLDL
jgi:hypothetical protein